jgi:hypothetical protein
VTKARLDPESIEEAINAVHVVALSIQDRMTAESAREWLLKTLKDYLRQGLIPTLDVIDSARKGDEIADQALREVGAEMLNQGEMPPAALRAYCLEALVRGPVERGPGSAVWYDNFRRDIVIPGLMFHAIEYFGHLELKTTRRPNVPSRPSYASIVAEALKRAGIKGISEGRINNIWSNGKLQLFMYLLKNNVEVINRERWRKLIEDFLPH